MPELPYDDSIKLLTEIYNRTIEGLLPWYETDKDIRCEAASVILVIKTTKHGGTFDSQYGIDIFDGEILLFRGNSSRWTMITGIRNVANKYIESKITVRLKDVLLLLSKEIPTTDLEISRES